MKIKLLPDDKDSIESSKQEIINLARQFVVQKLNKHLDLPGELSSGLDRENALLARDILSGRFWGTLSLIDGSTPEYSLFESKSQKEEEVKEKAEKARAWSQKQFHPFELEQILNIAVNQALLKPCQTAWPGTQRGHSLLYQELVEKECSIFRKAITTEFRQRLNNGRFWEELPYARVSISKGRGIQVVREVLENHYADLSVDFAVSQGLELIRNNTDGNKLKRNLDFRYLGEVALENYVQFLLRIDAHPKASSEMIEELLPPYIYTILTWDNDSFNPIYNGEKNSEGHQIGRFQDKLQAPILQKYLDRSSEIRKCTAEILADGWKCGSHSDGKYSRFVKEVLKEVTNSPEITNLILLHFVSPQDRRFLEEIRQT